MEFGTLDFTTQTLPILGVFVLVAVFIIFKKKH
jgi:hypothetical protein